MNRLLVIFKHLSSFFVILKFLKKVFPEKKNPKKKVNLESLKKSVKNKSQRKLGKKSYISKKKSVVMTVIVIVL